MSLTAIIAIIIAGVVVLLLLNLINNAPAKGIDREHFWHEWNDIINLSKDKKTQTLSVINADKLLDEALKCLNFKGSTMAERMISAKGRLKNKDTVWRAHKLRNKIVHESIVEPSENEIKHALRGFHQAFKDLGVF